MVLQSNYEYKSNECQIKVDECQFLWQGECEGVYLT